MHKLKIKFHLTTQLIKYNRKKPSEKNGNILYIHSTTQQQAFWFNKFMLYVYWIVPYLAKTISSDHFKILNKMVGFFYFLKNLRFGVALGPI